VLFELSSPADGFAFGRPGSPLAGLLFASHNESGTLTLIDLASRRSVEIASGGSRGDTVHISTDGRIYLAQSGQVDVLFPVRAPQVIASSPVNQAGTVPVINHASLVFDSQMSAGSVSDPVSVTNLANYRLIDLDTGGVIDVGAARYNAAARAVELTFESLQADRYQLTLA